VDRRAWIIVLAALGVGAIILIAILANQGGGESQAQARESFCSSLTALDTSISDLTNLDPSTASTSDYQSAVSEIENSWDQVKSDASNLKDISTTQLDDAWDSFKSAVDDVPSDASVTDALNDVKSASQSLASTVKTTLSGPDCS
jgi:hypothetical protein